MQIKHGADARGRGDLDGAAVFAHEFAMINPCGVGDLREIAILPAGRVQKISTTFLQRVGTAGKMAISRRSPTPARFIMANSWRKLQRHPDHHGREHLRLLDLHVKGKLPEQGL